jgi:transcriptional regulator with XRE-family HTH domain
MKRRALSEFGQIVNKKLIELNMTQKELSERIGTSPVYLSMILRGERGGQKYKEEILRILNKNKDD